MAVINLLTVIPPSYLRSATTAAVLLSSGYVWVGRGYGRRFGTGWLFARLSLDGCNVGRLWRVLGLFGSAGNQGFGLFGGLGRSPTGIVGRLRFRRAFRLERIRFCRKLHFGNAFPFITHGCGTGKRIVERDDENLWNRERR
jgi:hypothetical protein